MRRRGLSQCKSYFCIFCTFCYYTEETLDTVMFFIWTIKVILGLFSYCGVSIFDTAQFILPLG